MRERRQHTRYLLPKSWVAWDKWRLRYALKLNTILPWTARREITDISAGGLAFRTEDPPKEGAKVLLNVFMPREEKPAVLPAKVIKVCTERMGLYRVSVRYLKEAPDVEEALTVSSDAIPEEEPGQESAEEPAGEGEAPSTTVANALGMEFVLIPPGEFPMGSPPQHRDASPLERPQHWVEMPNAFYMSKFPVTRSNYMEIMGEDSLQGKSAFYGIGIPMDSVTHNDATEFCRQLSNQEGREYRLPTEAEWEYACRAGSTSMWCFGDEEAKLRQYAWYRANAENKTQPVVEKAPNAWGLHDMHGNVFEWCLDGLRRYTDAQVVDPRGPSDGAPVLRGGAWLTGASVCRSANRDAAERKFPPSTFGFRVVCVEEPG